MRESGFLDERTLPVEGPLGLSPQIIAQFQDQERRVQFLALARRIEGAPSLLGVSAHLLAVARKAPA